jgi:hypothetical protein
MKLGVDAGAIETVVAAMNAHAQHEGVCFNGARALQSFASPRKKI